MKLELRPLQETDIPDIIEISKRTWGGHDHLPLIINGWFNDPDCNPFVFVQDQKAIAVANLRLIDEHTTAWMEGLRVHENMQKQGLGEKMTHYLLNVAKDLKVKRVRLVTSGDNIAPMKLASGIGMHQVVKYNVFWKTYRKNLKWRNNFIEINEINESEVINLIRGDIKLLPHNVLIKHWDVYEATSENIKHIGKNSRFYGGSSPKGIVLTIGGIEPSRYGPEWCFTVFATNEDSFLSGLSANLSIAQEQNIRNLLCVHPQEYTSLYPRIGWLKRRSHEIQLCLHERVLYG